MCVITCVCAAASSSGSQEKNSQEAHFFGWSIACSAVVEKYMMPGWLYPHGMGILLLSPWMVSLYPLLPFLSAGGWSMLYRYTGIGCQQPPGRDTKNKKTNSRSSSRSLLPAAGCLVVCVVISVLFLAGGKFEYLFLLPSFMTSTYRWISHNEKRLIFLIFLLLGEFNSRQSRILCYPNSTLCFIVYKRESEMERTWIYRRTSMCFWQLHNVDERVTT